MKRICGILFSFSIVFAGHSQDLKFDIHTTFSRPVHKGDLQSAKTMSDINPGFPSSWISDYVSTELSTTSQGKTLKAVSPTDVLSTEQQHLLKMADMGSDILVVIKYNDKNSITGMPYVAKMDFKMTLAPESAAQYPGGNELMSLYLKDHAINHIEEPIAKQLQQAVIRFTVDEYGGIANAQISMSSKDVKTDQLLLEAINNMPKWTPAQNADGITFRQEFEFSVGTKVIGC